MPCDDGDDDAGAEGKRNRADIIRQANADEFEEHFPDQDGPPAARLRRRFAPTQITAWSFLLTKTGRWVGPAPIAEAPRLVLITHPASMDRVQVSSAPGWVLALHPEVDHRRTLGRGEPVEGVAR